MGEGPKRYTDPDACVEATLSQVGKCLNLGAPVGIGKPNPLLNAFYRRAKADPSIRLRIMTALSLERPAGKSELERRLVGPLAERLFGDYPDLEYVADLRGGRLPANVEVSEFYFVPGAFLGHEPAQERYISANYTAVVRDLLSCGLNVLAQMVAVDAEGPAGPRYSLSSNTDVTLDLLPILAHRRARGERIAFVVQTNRNLPFMGNDAVVPAEVFDGIVDNPALDYRIFGPPSMAVSDADYAIGLHASALVRDGGTLQLGIGALGDAVTYMLCLRHEHNAAYRELLDATGALARFGGPIECSGGIGRFREGLYGSTEMLVSGFLELRRAGILKREVYDDVDLQGLLNEGAIGVEVTPETLEALVDRGVVGPVLTHDDFARLQRFGILRDEIRYEDGMIHLDVETAIPADLRDRAVFDAIARRGLGTRLRGGHWLHAGFFVGPQWMYEALRTMDPAERDGICMTRISQVNSLFGGEMLRRVQRKDARFLNSGLVATLTGAIASDALETNQVVSGVGGQYDFVAMAHALDDARSILMIRATYDDGRRVTSNIRWRYGYATIPRHMRDIVVTEYGIADIVALTDRQVIEAMLAITDARFQNDLVAEAQRDGKLPRSYKIPDRFRENTPERLKRDLDAFRSRGFFPTFPFGTELTDVEVTLGRALRGLAARLKAKRPPIPGVQGLGTLLRPPAEARPYLERMGLDRPASARERVLQGVVLWALVAEGVL